MFQFKRQASLGNINIGKLHKPPSYEDIQFLSEQANKYRGRFVEISWQVAEFNSAFVLTTKVVPPGQPAWMLYRDNGGGSQLIWGHTTADLTLMHNLVMLECEKPSDASGNSISAAAADRLLSSNKGSMSRATHMPGEDGADKSATEAGVEQPPVVELPPVDASTGTGTPEALSAGAVVDPSLETSEMSPPDQPGEAANFASDSAAAQNLPKNPFLEEDPAFSNLLKGGESDFTIRPEQTDVASGIEGQPRAKGLFGAPKGKPDEFGATEQLVVEAHPSPEPIPQPSQTEEAARDVGKRRTDDQSVKSWTGTGLGASALVVDPGQNLQQASGADESLLQGSLSNISVANVLRYIANNGLTGRLAVQGTIGAAEVFFKSGLIQHAATLDTKGESAIFDLMTCPDGQFFFFFGEETTQKSVSTDINVVLEKGLTLVEQARYLTGIGLRPSQYLIRSGKQFSRQSFDEKAAASIADLNAQWRFYEAIDGNTTLADVLRSCPMVRSEWIPIVYNFLSKGMIVVSNEPADPKGAVSVEPLFIDQSAINSVLMAISDPRDLVLSYPALLYMCQQEFHRHERSGGRFSIIIFNVSQREGIEGELKALPVDKLREAASRVNTNKRRLDIFGHFENDDYALVLPETDAAGAAVFAGRVIDMFTKPGLLGPDKELVLSFGIACLPDDARDLATLLAAARIARGRSAATNQPIVFYSNF